MKMELNSKFCVDTPKKSKNESFFNTSVKDIFVVVDQTGYWLVWYDTDFNLNTVCVFFLYVFHQSNGASKHLTSDPKTFEKSKGLFAYIK